MQTTGFLGPNMGYCEEEENEEDGNARNWIRRPFPGCHGLRGSTI